MELTLVSAESDLGMRPGSFVAIRRIPYSSKAPAKQNISIENACSNDFSSLQYVSVCQSVRAFIKFYAGWG